MTSCLLLNVGIRKRAKTRVTKTQIKEEVGNLVNDINPDLIFISETGFAPRNVVKCLNIKDDYKFFGVPYDCGFIYDKTLNIEPIILSEDEKAMFPELMNRVSFCKLTRNCNGGSSDEIILLCVYHGRYANWNDNEKLGMFYLLLTLVSIVERRSGVLKTIVAGDFNVRSLTGYTGEYTLYAGRSVEYVLCKNIKLNSFKILNRIHMDHSPISFDF